ITFVDEEGKRRTPLILHNSPSGAIERDIYGLLEKAAAEQKQGKTPSLPVWLSPTQVRFVHVASRFVELGEKIADEFSEEGIRASVDDREESVGKRVRDAEKEWVPYIVVLGEKEASDQSKLAVRVRATGETLEWEKKKLIEEISSVLEGKPKLPLPLPRLMSKRPSFETTS
ncbi:MAG: His/Gly/Thr/Pro-type tRNA ligase C-terminal domain-containing protein, partial [Nitrososphaerales archaeon]